MPRPAPDAPPAEDDDPFSLHARREPLPGAAVRVVVVATRGAEDPDRVAEGTVAALKRLGRAAEAVVVAAEHRGWNRAILRGLEGGSEPLVLVTSAAVPWAEGQLAPLLTSINTCDHAVGRRPASALGRLGRWLASRPWRWLFALPVLDVHSPCRLHRREALAAIPLQSSSAFVDVEMLAKATFFGHLVDEVPVPAIGGEASGGTWGDFLDVFRHPALTFEELALTSPAPPPIPPVGPTSVGPGGMRPTEGLRPTEVGPTGGVPGASDGVGGSGPPEQPQRQEERDDGPGREDQQVQADVGQPGPLQEDRPEAVDELGQG